MTTLQIYKSIQENDLYSFFEVTLECGDLGERQAELYVDYTIDSDGYYKDRPVVNDFALFLWIDQEHDPKKVLIDLTDEVTDSLIDDLLNEALYDL